MSRSMSVVKQVVLAVALGLVLAMPGVAGTEMKWADVPKPVRDTILANGGKEGPVDKESETDEGKAIYEAAVTGKDGKSKDLVIREDGKLIEIKTDAAADSEQERADRGKKLLEGVKFTNPTKIDNPWLPLSSLKQDILEGTEGGVKVRVERTARPDLHKTIEVNGMKVEALVVEDRAFKDGQLEEVAIDYFAQDDNGTVYYLGEDVDEYKDGKIVNHDGTWLTGKDTKVPGVVMPAKPKIGDVFRSEDVSATIGEIDEVVSLTETVTVPAGTFKDCLKIKESLADGTTEFKYYAKGIGPVREVPSDGDEKLISHNGVPATTAPAKPATAPAASANVEVPTVAQVEKWVAGYKAAHAGNGGKDWDINKKSAAQIAADPEAKRLMDLAGPDQRPVIPAIAWEYGGKDHQWIKPEAAPLVICVYTPVKKNTDHWKYDKAKGLVTADVYVKFREQNPGKGEKGAAQVMSHLGDSSNIEILVDTASLNDGKDAGLDLSEAKTDLYLLLPDGSRVFLYHGD